MRAVHALLVRVVGAAALAVGEDGAVGPAGSVDGAFLCEFLGDFVGVVFVDAGGEEEIASPFYVGGVVVVLAWVGGLVFEDLDEFVETGGDYGSEDRAEPVDPVVVVERVVDDSWTEGTCRIKRPTSEVHSGQLGDEQRKTNT